MDLSRSIFSPTGYFSTAPKAILTCRASFLRLLSSAAATDAAEVGFFVVTRFVVVACRLAVTGVTTPGTRGAPRPNGGSADDRRFLLAGGGHHGGWWLR
jgi:hypothetical protein